MMKKSIIFIVSLGTIISAHLATAAPTSTITQNLFITALSDGSSPCLIIGSNGLVATSTCGTGSAMSSSTIWGLFSNTATGLTYDNTSGITSLTGGYFIPLTASGTQWNAAFASTSNLGTAAFRPLTDFLSSSTVYLSTSTNLGILNFATSSISQWVNDVRYVSTSAPTVGDMLWYDGSAWDLVPANTDPTVLKFLSQTSSSQPSWETTPIAGSFAFYLENVSSTGLTAYKQMADASGTIANITVSSISATTTMGAWLTASSSPGITTIPAGVWELHIEATKTGTKTINLYADVFRYDAGAETLLFTTGLSEAITGADANNPQEVDAHYSAATINVSSTSRLGIRWYASVSGLGTAPTVGVYYQGTTLSRLELPSPAIVANNFYLASNPSGYISSVSTTIPTTFVSTLNYLSGAVIATGTTNQIGVSSSSGNLVFSISPNYAPSSTIPTSTAVANWNSTYNIVNASSGNWDVAWTRVNASSSKWDTAYGTVNASSGNWNSAWTYVNASGTNLNTTYNIVNSSSGNWNTAWTFINASATNWNTAYTFINASATNWNTAWSRVNASSSKWDSAYASSTNTSWNFTNISSTRANIANLYDLYSNKYQTSTTPYTLTLSGAVSGAGTTAITTNATGSVMIPLLDATTTVPYAYNEVGFDFPATIYKIVCSEYAAATTTVDLFKIKSPTSTAVGGGTLISTSTACGINGTTTIAFNSSTITAGDYIVASTTATAGTPSWTRIFIFYNK